MRPPSLQTGEPRSASRLELFFDLAFVLVVAELATGPRDDPTVHGTLVFAGLFTVVWWSWMSSHEAGELASVAFLAGKRPDRLPCQPIVDALSRDGAPANPGLPSQSV